MSFQIGDKVAHPMYGAGVLESVVQKKVGGVVQEYYIMKLAKSSMIVMIPTQGSEEIGVRPVVDPDQADRVLAAIPSIQVEMTANWNHRYRENMERLKSGDLYQVARVIKGLMHRDRRRGLSTGERKMLHAARQILLSELVLSEHEAYDVMETRVDRAMMQSPVQ